MSDQTMEDWPGMGWQGQQTVSRVLVHTDSRMNQNLP